jgi:hypothetical protein
MPSKYLKLCIIRPTRHTRLSVVCVVGSQSGVLKNPRHREMAACQNEARLRPHAAFDAAKAPSGLRQLSVLGDPEASAESEVLLLV